MSETRDRVLSLRLTAAEHADLTERTGNPANLSDAVRRLLFDHLAEPPVCGATRSGTWNASYLPVCMLPAGHAPLAHWWRHPYGRVEMW